MAEQPRTTIQIDETPIITPSVELRQDIEENGALERTPSTIFKVVMIRGGDFLWGEKNIYCGWYDSRLSTTGRREMLEATKLLKDENYQFDMAYCSAMSRSKESLQIILDELDLNEIEIKECWQLNERHYGALTGFNRTEIDEKYGKEQIRYWLNSLHNFPPKMTPEHKYYDSIYNNPLIKKSENLPYTESLDMVQKRINTFWNKELCPHILSGRKILIVTHNSGLQALVQYLDDIEYTTFLDTIIPRATPFYYKLDETLTPILKDIKISNDLERKIGEAFEIFDHAGNGTVDIREIGTIVRSLGCVPSEAELQEILVATEYPDATGSIHSDAFIPHMMQLITEHRMQPASPDKLLDAFRKIDSDGHGYINKDMFIALMMEEGEQFSQDEIDEMMTTACDPQTQTIPYEYYINQLMYQPPKSNDLYYIADEIQRNKPKKSVRTASMILRAAEELQKQLDGIN